jgi:long-chain acyl-CoA synthetase
VGSLLGHVIGANRDAIPADVDPAGLGVRTHHDRRDPSEQGLADAFEGVPTSNAAMLNAPDSDTYDTSSLRVCISGGAAMPVEVMRRFEQHFDRTVLEGYGLSETSPIVSFNHLDRERKPGSIGTPSRGSR